MVEKKSLQTHFQVKRLFKIYWAIELALMCLFFQRLYYELYFHAVLTISIAISLLYLHTLIKQNKILEAATILLSVITLFCTYFMWENEGIYDEAVFVYPCILIMAAMIGNKRLFGGLVFFMASSILLNGISNQKSWYINDVNVVDLDGALLILLILLLISYTIWIMSTEFHALVNKLSSENIEVIKSKKEIEKLLHHDILTGLPNRVMAKEVFTKAVSKARVNNVKVCLMFIDLDNFKIVNDGLGHLAGDALLQELSKRFKEVVGEIGTVCRFAGDEFVIILDSIKVDEVISFTAQQLISSVQVPYFYQGNELICGCSIGITVSPNDASDFDSMVKYADTAMHHSKSMAGNMFHFFNSEMDTQGHDYLNVVSDLRKALKEEQFILHFQPKFDLVTNQIIGAEALIRWNHPEKGLIFPDFFIPQAEKSGLIIDIGEWVLKASCRACHEWLELGFNDFSVAVNASSHQFSRENLTQIVQSSLASSNLPAQHLEIEMTESLLIENSDGVRCIVKSLSDLGVSFSIDDFGTGYSNLSYLKEFDIETLKIDRSFVKDIEQDLKSKALVKAIIQMANSLSLKTVAEGIETKEISIILNELGCNYVQGYYYSKPICNEDFIKFSREYTNSLSLTDTDSVSVE